MTGGMSAQARKGFYNKGGYKQARAKLLKDHPPCVHHGPRCLGTASEADHEPPLSMHDHVPGTDCCVLVPSCGPCARDQGGQLGGNRQLTMVKPSVAIEPEPVPLEVFAACEWLEDLVDVPANATWPRLMTAPHPNAIGSLGMELEAFSLAHRGAPLRWWQKLAARRLLEYDAQGHLVWELAILTLSRQGGKSWFLGDLHAWRLESGKYFGGVPQTVVSTGMDIAVCLEVLRPYLVAAKRRPDKFKVREVNGQHSIELIDDGSRLMVRAQAAVYGLMASLASIDEGWKVPVSVLDDALEPTTVEAVDSQILLSSTAHRRATQLMIGRRGRALEHLHSGEGALLLEWSAPPDAAMDDRAAWRQASPYWSPKREKLIAGRLEGALSGESDDADEPDPLASFRSQWLNVWPGKRIKGTKGEPLVQEEHWEALRGETVDDPERIWVAVEDHSGFGAAIAAVCIQPDGRYGLDGWLVPTWGDALRSIRNLYATHEIVKLQAGASLMGRLSPGMRATPITSTVTRSTLPTMRSLVAAGSIVHDSPDLDDQIDNVRVIEAIGGLGLVAGVRSDLLRAASWALAAANRPRKTPSVH